MTRRISRSNLTRGLCLASERAFKREREPQRGLLASFALALGISLCSPAAANAPLAHKAAFNEKQLAKAYAKGLLSKEQFHCLDILYGLESKWDVGAYNKSGAYGIPQLKNKIIKGKSYQTQINYGLKYINARYNGDTCKALHHMRIHNWH